MTDQDRQSLLTALIEERRGYEINGLQDRIDAVDAELRRLGYEAKTPVQKAEKRPAGSRATKR